ncbi:MAG: dTMP kinase [Nanoarchaeota archaeon]|nr:dTMP kinase [Nanoarchaeota archaeon]
MTGKFIVIEGIDGSGTTTQAQLLSNYLFEKDKKNLVFLTREPTKLSDKGKELRRRLAGTLIPGEEVIHDAAYWVDLFVKDREWHLEQFIMPIVKAGGQVISDRHKLSTIAYQAAQGYDMDTLIELQKDFYPADLTLLFDLPVAMSMARSGNREGNPEYFETVDLQQRIRECYLVAAEKVTDNVVVIDASQSIAEVGLAVRKEVNKLYK